MKMINKIIIIVCFVLAIVCFSTYFILASKDALTKEEVIGDISFTYIDKSVYIKDAIPTLDKFGVMNDAFSFIIKNNNSNKKKYVLSLIDNNSTIKNSDIRYELIKNDVSLGISTLRDDGIIDTGDALGNEEIKYSIKLWLDYNSEYIKGSFLKKISVEELKSESLKINEPILVQGMIPVYYDYNNNSWYKADTNLNWYDYSEQKWANAVTLKKEKRDFYQKSNAGTKILLDDINSFWVWIPRFNYLLDNNNIVINYVSQSEQAYRAFSFNNQELPGFWISKYEAGISEDSLCAKTMLIKDCNHSNNNFYFVPNYLFANRMTMANMFYTIRKMELNGNIYGFTSIGNKMNNDGTIKNDMNNFDIHMIKNSEWQAVAILSDSKYGKKGNNSFEDKMIMNNNSNYTGKSFYQNYIYDYNVLIKGEGASTTGNVYGVYDMAGGMREYTMINNSKINLFDINSNSGFNNLIKDYYYDNDFLSDTTLQFQDRYSVDNSINNNPVTRGGYKDIGNVFNIYGANDFNNKISMESNTRACLVIVKEN